MNKSAWIALTLAMLFGSVISPLPCRAALQCPWLNAATAGGFLGGEVETNITATTGQGDATCDFRRMQSSVAFTLHIAVHTMTHPSSDFVAFSSQCDGRTIPLNGIGNEAVQCIPKDSSTTGEEQIIGRVRDRAFVIAVKRKVGQAGGHGQESSLSKEVRNVAEQVAGTLF